MVDVDGWGYCGNGISGGVGIVVEVGGGGSGMMVLAIDGW